VTIDGEDGLRPLAVCRTYRAIQAQLRARADEVGVSREALAELAGLPSGYPATLLAPHGAKRLGPISWDVMLPALGLAVVIVEDPAAVERMRPRWAKMQRHEEKVNPGTRAALRGDGESVAA
jgi:hypothetical protein